MNTSYTIQYFQIGNMHISKNKCDTARESTSSFKVPYYEFMLCYYGTAMNFPEILYVCVSIYYPTLHVYASFLVLLFFSLPVVV